MEPRRSPVDPAEHEQFLAAVSDSPAASRQLGSPPLVVASGFSREGVAIAEQQAQAIHILRRAATLAEAAGVTLLLEPLNTRIDHPGMFLNDTGWRWTLSRRSTARGCSCCLTSITRW